MYRVQGGQRIVSLHLSRKGDALLANCQDRIMRLLRTVPPAKAGRQPLEPEQLEAQLKASSTLTGTKGGSLLYGPEGGLLAAPGGANQFQNPAERNEWVAAGFSHDAEHVIGASKADSHSLYIWSRWAQGRGRPAAGSRPARDRAAGAACMPRRAARQARAQCPAAPGCLAAHAAHPHTQSHQSRQSHHHLSRRLAPPSPRPQLHQPHGAHPGRPQGRQRQGPGLAPNQQRGRLRLLDRPRLPVSSPCRACPCTGLQGPAPPALPLHRRLLPPRPLSLLARCPARPAPPAQPAQPRRSWARLYDENWSAFAPDFEELPQNREYVEREDEFDVNERPDEQEGAGAGGCRAPRAPLLLGAGALGGRAGAGGQAGGANVAGGRGTCWLRAAGGRHGLEARCWRQR